MNNFDIKAKDWDNNPVHVERAKAVSEAIKRNINLSENIVASHNMSGFEYGSGTGLLSFNLINSLKEITLADSSTGMIEAVNEKIIKMKIRNMKTILLDLENEDIPEEKYDIIYTQMTMHHVMDTDLVIDKFYMMLNDNGHIAISDLYNEDGSFHGTDFSGHKGFDPENLKMILERHGFQSLRYEECYKMKKIVAEKEKEFNLFLIIGQKR